MKEKKKILIIDDEKDFVDMVKWNLEKTGKYKVTIETDPRHGFGVAKATKPDLILLDVIMPAMDGGDVERQMREDKEIKDIPIVFLTAIVKNEEVPSEDGKIAGHSFLAKPVSLDKLIESIEKNIKD